ncbi:gluconokinase [Muriicola jejuensis]|uniref:Gluconokinase n=1 Tax=Muriicola jejuensis TaxID=504488 RepID=A0A6P0UCU4_9FLAO|nr:gluconokinase [Muriicola jejuensis]NER11074.1 adenylyl-sulfate kinase [Muriicola jejuensis]SMP23412.1 gluconokinase [Muriicola jejuensis]
MDRQSRIFFIMGVSGSGKSTIGKSLAGALSLPFFDGDDFHPESNITKMSGGIPLDDQDRKPWLETLNELGKRHSKTGAVIACSALKKNYRDILEAGITPRPIWVYLSGSLETIQERSQKRKGHFMPLSLLKSQFDTLEAPEGAIEVGITQTAEEILEEILSNLGT